MTQKQNKCYCCNNDESINNEHSRIPLKETTLVPTTPNKT